MAFPSEIPDSATTSPRSGVVNRTGQPGESLVQIEVRQLAVVVSIDTRCRQSTKPPKRAGPPTRALAAEGRLHEKGNVGEAAGAKYPSMLRSDVKRVSDWTDRRPKLATKVTLALLADKICRGVARSASPEVSARGISGAALTNQRLFASLSAPQTRKSI